VEGTAWHYAFHVPHDIDGLAAAHGGEDAFVADLPSLFDADRFAIWNEPDITFPWVFSRFDGEAQQTGELVQMTRQRWFGAARRDFGKRRHGHAFGLVGARQPQHPQRRLALVAAWVQTRNEEGATIDWLFDIAAARTKMARHYPEPTLNQSESLR
jgi:hypothetical protein